MNPHQAHKPKRGDLCGACGSTLGKSAARAYVASFDVLELRFVCAACAARGVLIVSAEPAQHARAVLAPFAQHLRRLAKPYELNGDGRAIGLLQAADILASGRAVAISPPAPASNGSGYRVGPLAQEVLALSRIDTAPKPPLATKAAAAAKADAAPDLALSACELALLKVLAGHGPIGRVELGLRAGYSVTSGGYSSALGHLRDRSLIAGQSGGITVTTDGLVALGASNPPDLPIDLVGYWAEKVGGAAGTILQVATAAYPDTLSRDELAERAGYRATSGGYSSALGRLRTLHLLDGCRASDELMRSATPPTSKEAHGPQAKNKG